MMIEALFQALLHSVWQGACVALVALAAVRCTRDPAVRHTILGLGMAVILALLPVTAMKMALPPAGAAPAAIAPTIQTLLVSAWVVGAVFGIVRLARRWAHPRRTTLVATAAPRRIQQIADDLARRFGLGPTIPVLLGNDPFSPSVFGWLKPVILVPGSLLTRLSPAEVEALIAHELAHVVRRDYLWLLMQSVAESILFFNPAVWLLSSLMREERENASDDLAAQVLGSKLRVARALVELETLRLQPTWSPAGVGGNIAGRIRRQLGMPEIVRRAWTMWSIGLAMLGGLALYFSPTSPAQPAKKPMMWESKVITIRMEEWPEDRLNLKPRMLILRSTGGEPILEVAPL